MISSGRKQPIETSTSIIGFYSIGKKALVQPNRIVNVPSTHNRPATATRPAHTLDNITRRYVKSIRTLSELYIDAKLQKPKHWPRVPFYGLPVDRYDMATDNDYQPQALFRGSGHADKFPYPLLHHQVTFMQRHLSGMRARRKGERNHDELQAIPEENAKLRYLRKKGMQDKPQMLPGEKIKFKGYDNNTSVDQLLLLVDVSDYYATARDLATFRPTAHNILPTVHNAMAIYLAHVTTQFNHLMGLMVGPAIQDRLQLTPLQQCQLRAMCARPPCTGELMDGPVSKKELRGRLYPSRQTIGDHSILSWGQTHDTLLHLYSCALPDLDKLMPDRPFDLFDYLPHDKRESRARTKERKATWKPIHKAVKPYAPKVKLMKTTPSITALTPTP